jgi:hypothetical protein
VSLDHRDHPVVVDGDQLLVGVLDLSPGLVPVGEQLAQTVVPAEDLGEHPEARGIELHLLVIQLEYGRDIAGGGGFIDATHQLDVFLRHLRRHYPGEGCAASAVVHARE